MLSKRGGGGSLRDGPLSREQDIVPVWRVRRVNLGAEKRGGGGEVMASIRGTFWRYI